MFPCNQNRETFYEIALFCAFGWTPSIDFILIKFVIQRLLPQLFSAVSTGYLSRYNVAIAGLQLLWKLAVSRAIFIDLIAAQMIVLKS